MMNDMLGLNMYASQYLVTDGGSVTILKLREEIRELKDTLATQATKVRAMESSKKRGQAYINKLREENLALRQQVEINGHQITSYDELLGQTQKDLDVARANTGKGDIHVTDCMNAQIHVHDGAVVGVVTPVRGQVKRRDYYGVPGTTI